jgi:hypothetical protein
MLPLENRGAVVLFPIKEKGSFLQMVQTDTGIHPISFQCALGIDFRGGKAAKGVRLTTRHLVPRLGMTAAYTPRPPFASMACTGTPLPLPYNYAWVLCRITSVSATLKVTFRVEFGMDLKQQMTRTYIRITLV